MRVIRGLVGSKINTTYMEGLDLSGSIEKVQINTYESPDIHQSFIETPVILYVNLVPYIMI